MRISKYKHPATRLKSNPNFPNSNDSTEHKVGDLESNLDNRSRLQRAMEAVDAETDKPPKKHKPKKPRFAPADNLDELMEQELEVDLPKKLESEGRRLDVLCRYEEKDIEHAVRTLKRLSREDGLDKYDTDASKWSGGRRRARRVAVGNGRISEKSKEAATFGHPAGGLANNGFNNPVVAKKPGPATREEMRGASFDRLLQIAPPLTLVLVCGIFSGMYAVSDWWPKMQPAGMAFDQQSDVGKKLVRSSSSPTEITKAYAAELPPKQQPLISEKSQARAPATPLTAQKIALASSGPSQPTLKEEVPLTPLQRLNAWDSTPELSTVSTDAYGLQAESDTAEIISKAVEVDVSSIGVSASTATRIDSNSLMKVVDNASAYRQEKESRSIESRIVPKSARNALTVELALNAAMGLDQLSAGDRGRLREQLVEGECTVTALAAVFDKVPILAIRDLRRSLGGSC